MTESTDHSAHPGPAETPVSPAVLADLAGMLAAVTRESPRWAAAITSGSLLEGHLRLDSLEAAELSELIQARYGVGLLPLLMALDIDQLIALTVGDLATYVEAHGTT